VWMERSEERSGPRQVSFGLCNVGLKHERIHVIRCDIENLFKLSHRIGKTTKTEIRNRVLAEQEGVARVQSLGFVKVGFAPVPLTSPAGDIGERFRNPAVIGQKRSRLLK